MLLVLVTTHTHTKTRSGDFGRRLTSCVILCVPFCNFVFGLSFFIALLFKPAKRVLRRMRRCRDADDDDTAGTGFGVRWRSKPPSSSRVCTLCVCARCPREHTRVHLARIVYTYRHVVCSAMHYNQVQKTGRARALALTTSPPPTNSRQQDLHNTFGRLPPNAHTVCAR